MRGRDKACEVIRRGQISFKGNSSSETDDREVRLFEDAEKSKAVN